MARNAVKQDEELKTRSNFAIIKRLSGYLKPFKLKIAIIILIMIFVMLVGVVNPLLLEIAIDKYVAAKNVNGLIYLGIFMIILNIISMYASKLRINMMSSVTNTALQNIRQQLYDHIQKLSFDFFDSRPVGKILARIVGDVNSLQDLFTSSVTNLIPDILNLVCVAAIMFWMNFRLALVSIIILPVLAFCMFTVETISRKRWQSYRQKRSNFNAFTHEDFSGIRIIQAFAAEGNTSKTFTSLVRDMMGAFVHAVKLNDLFWPMVETSWGIGTILIYWCSAWLISSHSITVGTLGAFTVYVGMFWRPLIDITDFYNTLITNFAAAERIFEIMDTKPNILNLTAAQRMPKIKGQVEFKDVTFGYDDGTVVLDDVSFRVSPGETVALVGPTGAGKTTIVNLISRFYDTVNGEVLIDNKNIKFVDIESLRSQMGIMLQDTFLFSATIKDNIKYGKLDATDEEIMAAAKAVNAHDFIMKMEKGYDTEVNERGSRLSVGQRQLISFARALLANPRILILDEATSNIDTYTERLVQNGIKKLLFGRTSFVIAHRLSTIRDCDRIMVIDEGRIVETGTHDELMMRKGLYYDLYMSQYKMLNEGA